MKKFIITILMFIMVFTFTACEDEGLPAITSLSDLDGRNIGVITGSLCEDIVEDSFDESNAVFYNNYTDAIVALENGKIDGFIFDEPTARCISLDNPNITYIDKYLSEEEYGFAFAKTEEAAALRDKMNAFIHKCEYDGSLEKLEQKWFYADYMTAVDLSETLELTGTNGTLTFVVDAQQKPPMAFLREDRIVGYEIDLVTLFCREYGYQLEIIDMDTDAMFSAIETGKADIAGSGINLNEEREGTFNYSSAYYTGGTFMLVRDFTVTKSSNPLVNIKDSFVSAFVTESRWKMYFEGINVTLLISILSIAFGGVFGYGLFLLAFYYGGNYKKFIKAFVRVIDGVPVLILLMIFYYLIFGSINISGTIVSIICFALVFAGASIKMFFDGLETIDKTQEEAARSLGYTKVQSLVKILLPQIFQVEYDTLCEKIIYIIQSTSVVGFIAVVDLTKVNDLIRSRTYDAFFPLILSAIIYFALSFAISKIIGKFVQAFNPRNRTQKDILKGVETHD